MAKLSVLETKMSEVFVDKAPKLPAGGKKFIVEVAPWLTLLAGVLSLWAGLTLWRWSRAADSASDYANSLCNAYAIDAGACADVSGSRFSVWVGLAIAILVIEGVLYLLAFPGLRARSKQGWNYVFYASLVSIAYSIVSLFTDYNAVGGFIFGLIGAAIGFWLLFQVRESYTAKLAKV